MASKNQHVQDNSVAERRLRPIYEWLDNGNNKKALQECEKVLKKTPNLHCAKALKALTLLRIGKEKECVTILDSLGNEDLTDEATLQAITLCCRELPQLERICKFYENAVKLDPTNEEFQTQLFMSYVRIYDFKSQQLAAKNLFKNKPKNPYYCWMVMSLISQATRGEGKADPSKRKLLLSLAERMMDKIIAENKMEAEPQVQLYIMILDLQQKYEEILKVLDGPLGPLLTCSNVPQMKLEYAYKLQRWNDVNLLCKSILAESMDRWDIWKRYISSVIELMNNNENLNNHVNHEISDNELTSVDDTPEKAHEFICRLVENGADNGYLLRGPYLARLELCHRLMEKKIDTLDLLGETTELMIEYFRKFGHKPCCVSDLRSFLILLDAEKKADMASRLIKDVGISSTNIPQSEQQMQRHICALQLSRLCGGHRNLSVEHLKALVTAFSLHYQHGHQSYGIGLLPTDIGPSDPYAILAAHVLYDLAQNQQSAEPIVVALVLLESLLNNSPSNFHAKLLCIKLYHTVGGTLGANQMYNSLDIKHLQLDSLGYVHCGRLATTGIFPLAQNLFDFTLKFFSSNYKDSIDHLTSSYKFGSFIKLDEFMDFRERMKNSLHYTTVAVDRIVLSMIQCASSDVLYNTDIAPRDNEIEWDLLRDNHDLSVYINWDPERINGPPEEAEDIKSYFNQNVHFLKLRAQMLLAMSCGIDIVKSTDGIRSKHIEELKSVLKEWRSLYDSIVALNYTPLSQKQVTYPLPSRLHCALQSPYIEVVGNFFNLLIATALNEDVTLIFEQLKTDLEKLTTSVENSIKNTGDFLQLRKTMEYVVNNIEVVCISCLICVLCHNVSKPTQGKKAKKKTSPARETLNELTDDLKDGIKKLRTTLESWVAVSSLSDITGRLECLNLNNNEHNVFENIVSSRKSAIEEILLVLNLKLKLLNSLN